MKKSEYCYLSFILCLAAIWRYCFLQATNSVIDADEAIVGLMARHILAGSEWPIFYYGQNYMGSFEAILTAGVFGIIGATSLALKVVPLVFSLYLILAIYLFTKRIASEWAAKVAVLLAAFPPSALTIWSTKARGGFVEIVALGTVSLLLAYLIISQPKDRARNTVLLGLSIGLGWWINNQMIYYALAAAFIFALFAPRALGWKEALRCAALGIASFIVGSVPFWYANLFHEPRFATFTELLGRAAPGDASFSKHLVGFFTESLPILVGAARFWSDAEVFPGAKLFFALLYVLLFLLFSGFFLAKANSEQSKTSRLAGYGLFISFFLVVAVIFSASSFGWLSRAPRYLLPLYSILFCVCGIGIYQLRLIFHRRGFVHSGDLASYAVLTVLLGAGVVSNFHQGTWYRPGEPVTFQDDRVSTDHNELYQWLSTHGYNHVFTNYWIGYRIAFETGERVTFSRYGEPRDLRIPAYEEKDLALRTEDRLYVVGPKEAAALELQLAGQGFVYKKSSASGYQLIYDIRPVVERGAALPLTVQMLSATHKQELLPLILDGDEETRWGSGQPQAPGMAIEIDFGKATLVSGLDLDYGAFLHDAATGLLISGMQEDGSWVELFKLGKANWYTRRRKDNGQAANYCEFYLNPRQLLKLRLEQVGSHPIFDWSVANIEVYSAK